MPIAGQVVKNNTPSTAKNVPTAIGARADFAKRLHEYHQWRQDLFQVLQEYQYWIEQHDLNEGGTDDLQIYELMEQLRSDKLVVALVGEFSRGKTELINAIFFADYKQRLLPSSAGRTTMCPTELQYDVKVDPCIRLLPIETRKTSVTISEYKRTPVHWTTIHLHKLDAPQEIAEAFSEIVKVKKVSLREAHELGLYRPTGEGPVSNSEMIEVPVWRHAIINFPHPLLKQGLVILDTPGLNALGTEPELTMSLLPQAHAVLFALAADTGVTRTDLDVWTQHVCPATAAKPNTRLAILNKIDTLWDDLQSRETSDATIARQVNEVASILDLDPNAVFPVSAQKGLVAKIKGEAALIQRSGITRIEQKLATDVLAAKQQLLRDKLVRDLGARIRGTGELVDTKLKAVSYQIAELKTLGGKSLDDIRTAIAELRADRERYDKELISFQATRTVLSSQAKVLMSYMNMAEFDQLMKRARRDMQQSWTTRGLKESMAILFAGIVEMMEKATTHAQDIKTAVEQSYHRFHQEFGLPSLAPAPFGLDPYRDALRQLEIEAEAFRNSALVTVTEQHFVIKKFFIALGGRARDIANQANEASKNWFRSIMLPVSQQIQEHKSAMDRRLENLRKAQENLDSLSTKISEMETVKKDLEGQRERTKLLVMRLQRPLA